MEFYLNQKSIPIIRRCVNCVFYSQSNSLCGKNKVSSAYDYNKEVYLKVSDNLYCSQHFFVNEVELEKEAVVVDLPSIQDAMNLILSRKNEKNWNNMYNNNDNNY